MTIADLLNRPIEQRAREFKYRCAQSLVFGIPVLVLQYFGPRLGGAEAPRWIAILQALLCGWIVYVGAAGMLLEGLVARTWQSLPDSIVALIAVGFYIFSIVGVLPVLVTGKLLYTHLLFHWTVIVLIAWTWVRAVYLASHSRIDGGL